MTSVEKLILAKSQDLAVRAGNFLPTEKHRLTAMMDVLSGGKDAVKKLEADVAAYAAKN